MPKGRRADHLVSFGTYTDRLDLVPAMPQIQEMFLCFPPVENYQYSLCAEVFEKQFSTCFSKTLLVVEGL